MKATLTLQAVENTLAVLGELTFATVTDLWQQSQSLFNSEQSPILLDLKNVTQSDSAGVALLIAWVRDFKQQDREIFLVNPPEQMQAIIRISGLHNVLPFVLRE